MIGNMLGGMLDFFANMLRSLFGFVEGAFSNLFDLIFEGLKFIARILESLFQGLINVLTAFFQVIYDLIRCILYLIYKIGVLAAKLFQVLWEFAKLLFSFVTGLTRTLASIFYSPPASGASHGYSEAMGQVMSFLHIMQLDVIAYILLFGIWFFVAVMVIKIVGTFKNI